MYPDVNADTTRVQWRFAIESGAFDVAGVKVEWVEVPGGTGAIVRMLKSGV